MKIAAASAASLLLLAIPVAEARGTQIIGAVVTDIGTVIDPIGAARAKLSEARTILLTQRALDMARFARLIEDAHQLAPVLDRETASILRQQAIRHAGLDYASGTIAIVDWAVTLDPTLALDDSLVKICNLYGQYPANVKKALQAKRAKEEKKRVAPRETKVVVVPFRALPKGTLRPIDSPTLRRRVSQTPYNYWPKVLTKVPPQDPRGPGAPEEEVTLTAMIEREGRGSDIKVVSGPEELRGAAVTAVRQWTFKPYRFLGNDVPCVAEIVVPFGQKRTQVKADELKDISSSSSATAENLPNFGEYVYVEELPEAIKRVRPEYSGVAREKRVEGTVSVQVLVGADGHVKDTRIVKSIAALDEAAVAAARQWVFKPAMIGGKPVAVWVAIPMRFPPK